MSKQRLFTHTCTCFLHVRVSACVYPQLNWFTLVNMVATLTTSMLNNTKTDVRCWCLHTFIINAIVILNESTYMYDAVHAGCLLAVYHYHDYQCSWPSMSLIHIYTRRWHFYEWCYYFCCWFNGDLLVHAFGH